MFIENKSHNVYIKDFNRLMFNKSKNKNKKYFCRYCLQCLNGKQCVKLSKGSINFKNYSKQIPGPFKIYADF